jgi:hypothetical protein
VAFPSDHTPASVAHILFGSTDFAVVHLAKTVFGSEWTTSANTSVSGDLTRALAAGTEQCSRFVPHTLIIGRTSTANTLLPSLLRIRYFSHSCSPLRFRQRFSMCTQPCFEQTSLQLAVSVNMMQVVGKGYQAAPDYYHRDWALSRHLTKPSPGTQPSPL